MNAMRWWNKVRRSTGSGNEGDQGLVEVLKGVCFETDFCRRFSAVALQIDVLSLQVLVQVDGVLAGNRSVAVQSGLLGLGGLGRHYGNLFFKITTRHDSNGQYSCSFSCIIQ